MVKNELVTTPHRFCRGLSVDQVQTIICTSLLWPICVEEKLEKRQHHANETTINLSDFE